MANLLVLDLGDEPFERGLLHGLAVADAIHDNVATYLRRFEISDVSRAAVLAAGDAWAERIAGFDGAYAAEMAGIAEGAEAELAEIAMLNARYELFYTLSSHEARGDAYEPDGCTVFAIEPEATRHGVTLIGQNWDWLARLRGRCLVLRVRQSDGPDFMVLTQAGIVGGMTGLNEDGIGFCVNGLLTDRDGENSNERPFHLRVREVMNARNLADALAAFTSTDRVCSGNYLFGHADGEIVNLEATPSDIVVLRPEAGILTHANHFEADMAATDLMGIVAPNSFYRASRLRRLIRNASGPVDEALMQGLLADHSNHPYAICRHPSEDEEDVEEKITVASVILNLDERVLYATDGPPCEADYLRIPLTAADG